MAIGGALRAAMRAGNWAKTAMESRRRAAALADLNARGGIRGSGGMRFPGDYADEATIGTLQSRGFLPNRNGWDAPGPRGGTVFANEYTGAREVLPPPYMGRPGPIEAPYEGMRVLPPGSKSGFENYGFEIPGFEMLPAPGPWQGGARGPAWHWSGYSGGDVGDWTRSMDPYSGIPFAFRPTGPITSPPYVMKRNARRPQPGFFFDDFDSGSPTAGLMGPIDPGSYLGFRTVRGFPFD
jgi:hypothetical protein